MSSRRFARWPDLFRSPVGVVAALMVGGFLLLAIVAPPLWSHAASKIDISAVSQGSTAAHPLGTDLLGRDILHRTLVATRLSVLLAVLASVLGAAVGIPIGVLPALVGRRLGRLITSAINLAVAFPTLLLAIFVASIVGLGAHGAVIGIAAAVAPYFARLSQTLAASVAGADYIAAARVLGIGRLRLTARHVLPNVAEPLLLTLMLTMGDALLALAGLSLLGVGVQPPSYDWGGMLTDGLGRIYVTPIVVVGPAVAIILAALGFNLLGETLAKRAARRDGTLPRKQEALPAVPVPEHRERVEEPVEGGRETVLDVRGLTVSFPGGSVPVRDISITVEPGEIVGIVGESGSGKSLTAMAIADLLPPGRRRRPSGAGSSGATSVRWARQDGAGCSDARWRSSTRIRWRRSIRRCAWAASSGRSPRCTRGSLAARRGDAAWSVCVRCGSDRPRGGCATTRSSSPGECGSES